MSLTASCLQARPPLLRGPRAHPGFRGPGGQHLPSSRPQAWAATGALPRPFPGGPEAVSLGEGSGQERVSINPGGGGALLGASRPGGARGPGRRDQVGAARGGLGPCSWTGPSAPGAAHHLRRARLALPGFRAWVGLSSKCPGPGTPSPCHVSQGL